MSGVVQPSIFNAKTMIINVSTAPTLVNLQHQETRNNHAIISPTTAIQNHEFTDKKVSPRRCPALHTHAIISGVTANNLDNPAHSIHKPKIIRTPPRILLHKGEHCFIIKINNKRNDKSVLLLCTYSKIYQVQVHFYWLTNFLQTGRIYWNVGTVYLKKESDQTFKFSTKNYR